MPRARDHALLRDMPDDDDGCRGRLGEAHELRRALAQLGDTARAARHAGRLHRLNRIDHQQRHFFLVGECDDRLQIVVGDTTQARGRKPQTLRTQSDLGNRLLTAGVEHPMRARNVCGNLQEQSRLAYARITSQQRHGPGYDTGAENAIELVLTAGEAFRPRAQGRIQRTRDGVGPAAAGSRA